MTIQGACLPLINIHVAQLHRASGILVPCGAAAYMYISHLGGCHIAAEDMADAPKTAGIRAEATVRDCRHCSEGGIVEVLYTPVSAKLDLTAKQHLLVRAAVLSGLVGSRDLQEYIRLAHNDKNNQHEVGKFKVDIRRDKYVTLSVKTDDDLLSHEVAEALLIAGWQHLGYTCNAGIFRDRWGWLRSKEEHATKR